MFKTNSLQIGITIFFGFSLFAFFAGFLIIFGVTDSAVEFKSIIDSSEKYFGFAATFLTTVFSALLAFILGYYFSEFKKE